MAKRKKRQPTYQRDERQLEYLRQLKEIRPKTYNQRKIFSSYYSGKHLMIHGMPGTGKTFISMYLALSDVVKHKRYEKVIIFRSAVATRAIGFLPGRPSEKVKVFESPYENICTQLYDHDGAYQQLKNKGIVEFQPTSFLRGVTLEDSIVIVDEVQNLNDHEVHTLITRMGENSRIIFCGDFRQNDFATEGKEETGIHNLMKVVNIMQSFSSVEMQTDDIVRSGLVKEYITARAELGLI